MPSVCPRRVELYSDINFYVSRVIGIYLDIRTNSVPCLSTIMKVKLLRYLVYILFAFTSKVSPVAARIHELKMGLILVFYLRHSRQGLQTDINFRKTALHNTTVPSTKLLIGPFLNQIAWVTVIGRKFLKIKWGGHDLILL